MAIECKWSTRDFDPANLLVFARAYPQATLLVTAPDVRPALTREFASVKIAFLALDHLVERIVTARSGATACVGHFAERPTPAW